MRAAAGHDLSASLFSSLVIHSNAKRTASAAAAATTIIFPVELGPTMEPMATRRPSAPSRRRRASEQVLIVACRFPARVVSASPLPPLRLSRPFSPSARFPIHPKDVIMTAFRSQNLNLLAEPGEAGASNRSEASKSARDVLVFSFILVLAGPLRYAAICKVKACFVSPAYTH